MRKDIGNYLLEIHPLERGHVQLPPSCSEVRCHANVHHSHIIFGSEMLQAAANCRRALLKRLRDGDWRAEERGRSLCSTLLDPCGLTGVEAKAYILKGACSPSFVA